MAGTDTPSNDSPPQSNPVSPSGASSGAVPSTSAVNPQIVDAVTTSTSMVFGLTPMGTQLPAGTSQFNAGSAIAYEKAAQAAALTVQDAADYQRNVLSICSAAQGKALAMMLANPASAEQLILPFGLALVGSLVAGVTAGIASVETAKALGTFPKN